MFTSVFFGSGVGHTPHRRYFRLAVSSELCGMNERTDGHTGHPSRARCFQIFQIVHFSRPRRLTQLDYPSQGDFLFVCLLVFCFFCFFAKLPNKCGLRSSPPLPTWAPKTSHVLPGLFLLRLPTVADNPATDLGTLGDDRVTRWEEPGSPKDLAGGAVSPVPQPLWNPEGVGHRLYCAKPP